LKIVKGFILRVTKYSTDMRREMTIHFEKCFVRRFCCCV